MTPAERDAIEHLLKQGKSNKQIALALGYASRCVVAGLIHRNDLARFRIVKPPKIPRRKRKITVESQSLGLETDKKRLSLMQLKACQCRWPVAFDREIIGHHIFCGDDTRPGENYCKPHQQQARARS